MPDPSPLPSEPLPFHELLGLEIVSTTPGNTELRLTVDERHLRDNAIVHGGASARCSTPASGWRPAVSPPRRTGWSRHSSTSTSCDRRWWGCRRPRRGPACGQVERRGPGGCAQRPRQARRDRHRDAADSRLAAWTSTMTRTLTGQRLDRRAVLSRSGRWLAAATLSGVSVSACFAESVAYSFRVSTSGDVSTAPYCRPCVCLPGPYGR